jgi:hypothetical protein
MPVCWLSASSYRSQRIGQVLGRDILIWSGTDPGLRDSAVSALLQFLDEVTQAATQHAFRRSAAEQTALSARN